MHLCFERPHRPVGYIHPERFDHRPQEMHSLVIVASSSALGDYFTGWRGSTLWIDELELVYD